MPKEDTIDRFFDAVNEAYDALLDAAKAANDRGYRISRRFIDDIERGQRDLLDMARTVATTPRDVAGFYSASMRTLTSAQGRLLDLTRQFVDEISEGQREGRDTLRRVIEANRTAGQAAIEAAREGITTRIRRNREKAASSDNGRAAPRARKARSTTDTSA